MPTSLLVLCFVHMLLKRQYTYEVYENCLIIKTPTPYPFASKAFSPP